MKPVRIGCSGWNYQRLARDRLSEGPPGEALARALRDALRDRRDQQHLLPASHSVGRPRLGGANPRRLRLHRQGESLPDAHETADRHEGRRRALLRADRAADHSRRQALLRVPPPELVHGRRSERARSRVPTTRTFIRFHYGHRGRKGNYSESELEAWKRRIYSWSAATEVFAYFNNDWHAYAVKNALFLQARASAIAA